MPSQQNTYRKLDRDTANNKVDKQSYFDCRNLRLLSNSPNESGALVSILGNERLITAYPGHINDFCIGSKQIRDKVIIITTDSQANPPVDTYGRLWTWDLKNDALPVIKYNGLLNLSRAFPIGDNIITRYENENIQKVYWADGNNNLRYCNIADPNLSTKDPDDFNIVNEVSFQAPYFERILGGKIPVGRVQYAYRLYKKHGGQTIFSPASKMINLTTANESASNTSQYRGADRLVDASGNTQSSGKSIKMVIENVDSNYDKIEIVAIHYVDINEVPNIWVVLTTDIGPTIHFTDTGVYNQGYYTLSEYVALSNMFKPKTIATKNNILFAANIETEEFDVEYDARAYRYRYHSATESRTDIKDSSGGYYYVRYDIDTPEDSDYNAYDGAPPISGLADIPADWDCIQDINSLTIDPAGALEKYQKNGTTLGGEGVNVSYQFKVVDKLIDNSANNQTFHVGTYAIPYYFPSSASPFNAGYRVGYPRDEIYRFGVIFLSTKGQPSPVKYIGDIRFPNHYTSITGATNRHAVTLVEGTYSTTMYLEFTLNNIPDNVAGYQIVRVERKAEDRTILFQGRMSFMREQWGGPRTPALPDNATAGNYNSLAPTSHAGRLNLWAMAPEISFYKDYKAAANDYVQVVGYYADKLETTYGVDTWHNVNKYINFTSLPYLAAYKKSVVNGKVVEAPLEHDQLEEVYNFENGTFLNTLRRRLAPPDLQICNLGTGAIIKLASSFDLTALPSSSWPVINYRRPVVQYGGNTHEARLGNKYIPASEYHPRTGASMTNPCYGGDSYIQFFDHLHGYFNHYYAVLFGESMAGPEFDTAGYVDMFPVETTINLDLRHDDCWHRIYNASEEKYFIRETANAVFTVQDEEVSPGWSDYYLYNTVYSRNENARQYIQVATDWESIEVRDSMVIASIAKYNGEEIDSWTRFPLNESIEVDSGFGPINYLKTWNNALLFYQDDGFGNLAVLERSLIQDSDGRNLTLGEGDVLQRYDMISSETGCSTRGSLLVLQAGLIWYDNKKRRMYRLTKSIENLGILKGVHSYLQSIDDAVGIHDNTLVGTYKGFIMGYNSNFNEIWFTIKTGHSQGETLVFNEVLDNFTGFIDNNCALCYITQDDILLSERAIGDVYKENSTAVPRCSFYGTIKNAVVEVIFNPAGTLVNTLNNLEFTTAVLDDSDVNILDETITSLRVTNDYQDTGVITLTPGTNIRRLLRTWRINTLRDTAYNARLRDTYAKIRIVHTNDVDNPRKIIIHDMISMFSLPIEAVVNKK